MAHIPMDDINQLWEDNQERSWKGLYKTLEEHKGKTNGISDNLIMMMMPETQDMEKAGKPYPDSPQQLYDILNQNLDKYQVK